MREVPLIPAPARAPPKRSPSRPLSDLVQEDVCLLKVDVEGERGLDAERGTTSTSAHAACPWPGRRV